LRLPRIHNICSRLLPDLAGGVSVFGHMKRLLYIACIVALMGAPAYAQTPDIIPPEEQLPDAPAPEDLPDDFTQGETRGTDDGIMPDGGIANSDLTDKPDYSQLTPDAERMARLDALFIRLKAEKNEDTANLIAEEIWAIWLDSGSASVNFVMRRGIAAQKSGEKELARRMFDQVTTLEPTYAEGWSRSARLATEEEDLNRALVEITQALIYEPRHFYALWTLGNIMERLGRNDDAFEAYAEAHKLYPELKAVKDRVEAMRAEVEGDVL